MTLGDQLTVQHFVDSSIHDLTHAIVEACYRNARKCTTSGAFGTADDWSMIARRLTMVEADAAKLDLTIGRNPYPPKADHTNHT